MPPDDALAGLIAYLGALRSEACPMAEVAITLALSADDVRRALAAAENSSPQTARLLLFAAQDGVGRIVERLPRDRFAAERERLESLARQLGAVRSSENAPLALVTILLGWRARFDCAIAHLGRHEDQTYFSERVLGAALER